jgi:putative FmdB family regulatory protein
MTTFPLKILRSNIKIVEFDKPFFLWRKNMPFYEFQCSKGTVTEKLVPMETKSITCPDCRKRARKIISPCSFKLVGGGWYADGYSSSKGADKKDKN